MACTRPAPPSRTTKVETPSHFGAPPFCRRCRFRTKSFKERNAGRRGPSQMVSQRLHRCVAQGLLIVCSINQDCSKDGAPLRLRLVSPLHASGVRPVVRSMAAVLTRKYVPSADTKLGRSMSLRKDAFHREIPLSQRRGVNRSLRKNSALLSAMNDKSCEVLTTPQNAALHRTS